MLVFGRFVLQRDVGFVCDPRRKPVPRRGYQIRSIELRGNDSSIKHNALSLLTSDAGRNAGMSKVFPVRFEQAGIGECCLALN
jgi:hypothetical protein